MDSMPFKGVSGDLETNGALGLDESDKGTRASPRVVSLLGSILERMIVEQHGDGSARKDIVTIFHGPSAATSLSITEYLEHISNYSNCSCSCFVLAFIYIDRFLRRKDARLTPLNVHRLVFTSVVVAAKFWDECYTNADYAIMGGVSTQEMKRMEMELLFDLDFKLYVTDQVFSDYCLKLEEQQSLGVPPSGHTGQVFLPNFTVKKMWGLALAALRSFPDLLESLFFLRSCYPPCGESVYTRLQLCCDACSMCNPAFPNYF